MASPNLKMTTTACLIWASAGGFIRLVAMSAPSFAKCACSACGLHIEFPVEGLGAVIACPHCAQETALDIDGLATAGPDGARVESSGQLSFGDLQAAFGDPVSKTPASFFYMVGLMIVATVMILLPILYLAMIGAAGWLVYYWTTHFTFIVHSGGGARVMLLKVLVYITPLFSGVIMVFFMVKPLFARIPGHAQPLALNPGAEPLLFAFIAKICEAVGAPTPTRIDLDCQVNAAAGFRRGFLSFLGNDLVLTIGLPLVAGLNTRQLAGIIAHEFGHFSQGFAMRLTYVIRRVNGWFARVAYERDQWDLIIEEMSESEETWSVVLGVVSRLAVWASRLLLKALMYIGHIIGCFMLRQMEYDADSYEIKVAGSENFESAARRLHVLGAVTGRAYQGMKAKWNKQHQLPGDFSDWVMQHDANLPAEIRTKLEDTMGLDPTGLMDTHPSNGDRIRRARQAAEPGVFTLEIPAHLLFSNFDVISRQVTALHYTDDFGLSVTGAMLGSSRESAPATSPVVTDSVSSGSDAEASPEKPPARIRLKPRPPT